jgi:hypothetical protein
VPFYNGGSLPASEVSLSSLSVSAGTIINPPAFPFSLGASPIRVPGQPPQGFDLVIQIPPGTKGVTISGKGSATGGDSTFPVPSVFRGKKFEAYAKVGPPGALIAPSIFAAATTGTWQLSISNPDQAAVPSGSVVYSGVIQNNTGTDIFLNGTDLQFSMNAPLESYEFELAPGFSAMGGVIPPEGYAGPLLVLTFLRAPPVGSFGGGTLALTPEAESNLPALAANFSSAYKLQELAITQVGSQALLSWSTEAVGMVLQSTDDLAQPDWADVNAPVTPFNGRNTVTIPVEPAPRFYRLVSFY